MAVKIKDIIDEERFGEWLREQDVKTAQVLATRIALRALPTVLQIHTDTNVKLSGEDKRELSLQVFRTNFILWFALSYPDYAISDATTATVNSTARAIREAVGGNLPKIVLGAPLNFVFDIPHYAGYAAQAALTAATGRTVSSGYNASYSASFDNLARSNIRSVADAAHAGWIVWNAIEQDCNYVIAHSIDELWSQPLWMNRGKRVEEGAAITNHQLRTFKHSKEHRDYPWGLWLAWYEGQLQDPAKSRFGKDADLKIAGLSDEEWSGDAKDVMERLAGIVGWDGQGFVELFGKILEKISEEGDSQVDPSEIIDAELQTSRATRFKGNEDSPLEIDHNADGLELHNNFGARQRHGEVVRLCDGLLNSFDRNELGANSSTGLLEDVELYRDALGDSPPDVNIDLVAPRGDALRTTLEAYQGADDFSNLPPIPDNVLLNLDKLVKAINSFMSLDPVLAERDETLLGPDAKKTLVSKEEGQAAIHNAVEQSAAVSEVEDVLAEEAKVAPNVPDPENRNSRRYSEGVKNFSRAAIGRALGFARFMWNHKGKFVTGSVSTTAGAYAAAQWTVANEVWLLKIFGNNPAMVDTITRVWTQFAQHLIAKSWTIDRKLQAFFSNLVASLRMSFILQKKRSTMFLCL